MNANQVIEVLGGRAEAIRLTGLTKGRISQWAACGVIPRPWMMFFHERYPDKIPHPDKPELKSPNTKEAEHV
ncbi:hypothetical protein ACMHYO_14185 [Allopusillimonas ginsengisoli]|uniref:hypothetical protein n=1 Tax=Allopusillimonas ginsengisoli TaxID=453575 RepID=UPI0039C20C4C